MTQTCSFMTLPYVCSFLYKFTGKERDTESGNDYFGARYYGSNMGRFMSPDYSDDDDGPVSIPYYNPSNPQSLNLYSYVHNNPLVNTDPDGHDCIYADGNGGGYVQRGDCTNAGGKDDNGVYVDGTIDVNSFKYNASNNSSSFSFTPNDAPSGAIGTGVLQGPNLSNGPTDGDAYFAAASMIGNGGMAAIKDFTIGSVVGGAIGGAVLASGAGAAALTTLGDLGSGVTEHAEEAKLLARHGITPAQARAAIKAAKKSGDVVEAMGRYGPQLRYTANGIRVVVATTGRNAGKIITAFFK
jgi:RHS repeat-associated protein